jgi:hypothetical protein
MDFTPRRQGAKEHLIVFATLRLGEKPAGLVDAGARFP